MKAKTLLLTTLALGLFTASQSQSLTDKDTFVMDSVTIHVGDDLTIGTPSQYDFVNIQESKRGMGLGKIANVAGNAGLATALLGVETKSVGTLMTGAKVLEGAGTLASVGMTADAIAKLNVSNEARKIIGKKFRVMRLKQEGSKKRGEHYYAIVAGEGHTNYKIELPPAIQSNEILAVNNQLFHPSQATSEQH